MDTYLIVGIVVLVLLYVVASDRVQVFGGVRCVRGEQVPVSIRVSRVPDEPRLYATKAVTHIPRRICLDNKPSG